MEPIAVWVRGDGEWALVPRCSTCGELDSNRIAGDDNEFVLMSLASRPMAAPPFPLEPLSRHRGDDGDPREGQEAGEGREAGEGQEGRRDREGG